MTVDDFIKKLAKYPSDMKVVVTDGFEGRSYSGDFVFKIYENTLDIGIGGMYYNAEDEEKDANAHPNP